MFIKLAEEVGQIKSDKEKTRVSSVALEVQMKELLTFYSFAQHHVLFLFRL